MGKIAPVYDAVTNASPMVVGQLRFLATQLPAGAVSICHFEGAMIVADNEFDCKPVSNTGGNGFYVAARFVDNEFSVLGQIAGSIPPTSLADQFIQNGGGFPNFSTVAQIFGGSFFDSSNTYEASFANVWVDYDVNFVKPACIATFTGVNFYGCFSLQSVNGRIRLGDGYMAPTTSGACATNALVWYDKTGGASGTGVVTVDGSARWSYAGATATNTFLSGIGLRINNLGLTACSHTGAAPDVINCGITLNQTNLDAAASSTGFGGLAFMPGGGSFSSVQ